MDIGIKHIITRVVEYKDSAVAMGSGAIEVFATPAMILWMEEAARNAVADTLPKGSTTVGTLVNVKHIAATRVGKKVCIIARLTGIDKRLLSFAVEARENNIDGKLLGEGIHERAIIDIERFMGKLT